MDALYLITPKHKLHKTSCEECQAGFNSIVSNLVMPELGTSFSDLRLGQAPDQGKLLENPEILTVRNLLQSSPSRAANGDYAGGTKAKRKKNPPKPIAMEFLRQQNSP